MLELLIASCVGIALGWLVAARRAARRLKREVRQRKKLVQAAVRRIIGQPNDLLLEYQAICDERRALVEENTLLRGRLAAYEDAKIGKGVVTTHG